MAKKALLLKVMAMILLISKVIYIPTHVLQAYDVDDDHHSSSFFPLMASFPPSDRIFKNGEKFKNVKLFICTEVCNFECRRLRGGDREAFLGCIYECLLQHRCVIEEIPPRFRGDHG